MDLPRPRRPEVPSDLARRRLELLGAQLGPSRRPADPGDLGGTAAASAVVRVVGDVPDLAPSVSRTVSAGAGRHRAGAERSTDLGVDRDAGPGAARRDLLQQAALAITGDRPVRRQHVLVGAVVVVLALVATLWWVAGSRPEEVRPLGADTAAPTPDVLGSPTAGATAAPDAGATSGATDGASAPARVVVDVTGKVRRPGIVTLPSGSRVADAVTAAGGSRPGADLSSINLARVLVDGEQVVVGLPAVAPVAPPGPSASGSASGSAGDPSAGGAGTTVDLNTATLEQLDTLPGIGPVTAQAILDHRAEIGRFTSVDELMEVRGIGDARMADLRDLVRV